MDCLCCIYKTRYRLYKKVEEMRRTQEPSRHFAPLDSSVLGLPVVDKKKMFVGMSTRNRATTRPTTPAHSRDLPVRECLSRGGKLSEFIPNHFIRDRHREVVLAIVDHEPDPNKRREDSA